VLYPQLLPDGILAAKKRKRKSITQQPRCKGKKTAKNPTPQMGLYHATYQLSGFYFFFA
jgi:hypothetical protein